MTRFARFGQNNKRTHDATEWKDMKTNGNSSEPMHAKNENAKSETSHQERKNNDQKGPLRGVKKAFQKSKGQKFMSKKGAPSDLECYQCHQKGHKVSECSEPGKHLDVQCYNCKEIGHKSFNCPKAPRKVTKNHNQKFAKFMEKNEQDWKQKRSEHRRLKRQDDALTKLQCFNCREKGHKISECPEVRKDKEQGTNICFKCGSTEHTAKQCKSKLSPGEFPFAKCFICGEKGHISSKCPDNPRGLYPNGGGCRECGSVEHLQRDCPERQRQQGISSMTLERLGGNESVDQEQMDVDQKVENKSAIKSKPKTKAKVVSF